MYLEYPEELRRVLGVRYCTLCLLEPERYGFDLPQLLWANEPFDAAVVERELLDRGWLDVSVRPGSPEGPWLARVGGDPPAGDRWVGFRLGDDHAGRITVARWPHKSPYLILYSSQNGLWRAIGASTLLYDKYDSPKPHAIGLTRHQAERLSLAEGRPPPTDAEVATALRAESDRWRAFSDRRDRFYAARAARFAAETADLRTEAERLAAVPPPLHRTDGVDDRKRVVAALPPVPVRLGESFPLLRFLVGLAHDGPARARSRRAYRMLCNRLGVTVADGVTLDLTLEVSMRGGPFWGRIATPYVPAEADLVRDPAFPALKPPTPPHVCLSSEVFPASPLHLTIRGEVDPATLPDRWRPLGIVLTFPGGIEYVTVPLVATGVNPAWHTARRHDAGRGAVGPEANLYVPDDINLLKPVRARLVPAPPERR
jgi:hypothetical protein